MNARVLGAVAGVVCAGTVVAEEVRVVADIAPVHSIVTRVMEGVGTPDLIVRPEESPHDFSMRPSTARALQNADIVIWVGEALVPNLEKPLETVAGMARTIELIEVEGVTQHDFREVAVFGENDDHDEHEEGHDDHEEAHEHDGHEKGQEDHAEEDHHHDHEGLDPHMWLDPENAKVWAAHIAAVLSDADPDNTVRYEANTEQLIRDLDALSKEIEAQLEPVAQHSFVVFHDAYQYFEHRFGLKASGALLVSDAQSPSAARLAEVQEVIEEQNITCVFIEPQFDPRLVDAVAAKAKTGEMDPMGVAHSPGGDLYMGVLRGLTKSVVDCLKD